MLAALLSYSGRRFVARAPLPPFNQLRTPAADLNLISSLRRIHQRTKMAATFTHPEYNVPVRLPDGLSEKQLLDFHPFDVGTSAGIYPSSLPLTTSRHASWLIPLILQLSSPGSPPSPTPSSSRSRILRIRSIQTLTPSDPSRSSLSTSSAASGSASSSFSPMSPTAPARSCPAPSSSAAPASRCWWC